MPERAVRAFLVTLAAGLPLLAVAGLTQRSTLVYTPGVTPATPVADLQPGQETCQRPLSLPDGARFERVRLYAGTPTAPGPRLEVTVRPVDPARPPLGRGRIAGGYRGRAPLTAAVGEIRSAAPLAICVRNRGPARAAVWGSVAYASGPTEATLDGKPVVYDLAVRLERDRPRSLLALLGAIGERASLFKPRWCTPAVLGLLGLLALAGVPALIAVALRDAER